MPAFKDLSGQLFGRLTVIFRGENEPSGGVRWRCRCSCGSVKDISSQALRIGLTVSCGCYAAEVNAALHTKHGRAREGYEDQTYSIWRAMRQRCTNPRHKHYPSYGGRGITVCPAWRDFDAFLKDMGDRPIGMSLDRSDNDGNYSPENCRWVSAMDQSHNRRNNVFWTHNGDTKCLSEWSRHFGITISTVHERLHRGWTIEKALTTAPRPKRRA